MTPTTQPTSPTTQGTGISGVNVPNIVGSTFEGWIDPSKLPDMTKNDIINQRPDRGNYTDNNRVHIRDGNDTIRVRLDPSV